MSLTSTVHYLCVRHTEENSTHLHVFKFKLKLSIMEILIKSKVCIVKLIYKRLLYMAYGEEKFYNPEHTRVNFTYHFRFGRISSIDHINQHKHCEVIQLEYWRKSIMSWLQQISFIACM